MNVIRIVGRLTHDPDLRTTTTGKQVASFSVAVNKRFKPQDGSADADFFRVSAWGQTAEYVSNYLSKGRLVAVSGRIESRKFTDRDGNNRETWEVTADSVQGLDRPRDDDGGSGSAAVMAGGNAMPSVDEFDPFADE